MSKDLDGFSDEAIAIEYNKRKNKYYKKWSEFYKDICNEGFSFYDIKDFYIYDPDDKYFSESDILYIEKMEYLIKKLKEHGLA